MKHSKRFLMALAAATLLLSACGGDKVFYADPVQAKPLTTGFTFSDLSQIAMRMTDSMLTSPATVDITRDYRPLIVVDRVKNETDQHINTASITDSIRTQLIRSGKFRFLDKGSRSSQREELEYQNYSGMVDKQKATAIGQQFGAEYILEGKIVSYTERNKKVVRKAYKFTLNLINLQTGVIEWADEVPIAKTSVR